MDHQLKTHYRGADLILDFNRAPDAQLRINGIVRDKAASTQQPITLKLSSSVQTDYEWHEFVEATLVYDDAHIRASLTASGEDIASMDVDSASNQVLS